MPKIEGFSSPFTEQDLFKVERESGGDTKLLQDQILAQTANMPQQLHPQKSANRVSLISRWLGAIVSSWRFWGVGLPLAATLVFALMVWSPVTSVIEPSKSLLVVEPEDDTDFPSVAELQFQDSILLYDELLFEQI